MNNNSLIVFSDGTEMRPEEAICHLAEKVTELVIYTAKQDREIDHLKERIAWFESCGL